jgi:biopolymer transport protein ExbD
MVFVAFFIAIVFLLFVSQMRTHALLIDLPLGYYVEGIPIAPYATVEIDAQGALQLDGVAVELDHIADQITASGVTLVLVKAEAQASYGNVAQTLARIASVETRWLQICFDPSELAEHRYWEWMSVTLDDDTPVFLPASTIIESPDCGQFYPMHPDLT